MALMLLAPLSASIVAAFPHVLDVSGYPPVPNPILESQESHLFPLLPRMPILAFAEKRAHLTLKPSVLQTVCNEASKPINFFHVTRPNEVVWYWPSAISE